MRLTVSQLSVTFRARRVLSVPDASFDPNCVNGIVGPSGSGKSTFLAAISNLERSQGTVCLEIRGARMRPSPRHVAWVPQGAYLLSDRSILDNVRAGALSDGAGMTAATQRAEEGLDKVGLLSRATERTSVLSGGEMQRVAFARAMASARPILLADEPTASLDRVAAQTVVDLLQLMPKDRIVLVATHDQALVAQCDTVLDLSA